MGTKLYIKTYGCQMNEYDSDKTVDILKEKRGVELTNNIQEADIILLNTCSIRDKAESKVYSELGRLNKLKEKNPNLKIGVGGCVATQEGSNIKKRAPYVDLIYGPQTLHRVSDLLDIDSQSGIKAIDITFPIEEKFDSLPNPSTSGPSSYVAIMEGCSKYCSFCVVPYTRGDEVSRKPEQIFDEVARLAEQGVTEITFIGQNVNSYKMPYKDRILRLSDLIEIISHIDGIERIRYTTSHPLDMTDDLIEVYQYVPQLVSQLHLPVQSGSNRILEKMKRNYTIDIFLDAVERIKSYRPDLRVSSDFIVGFPGETDHDFQQTMSLVNEVKFDSSFSFIYSKRPGTPASKLEDNTSQDEKKERLKILQEQLNHYHRQHSRSMVGSIQRCLVTGLAKRSPEQLQARTECNRVINFDLENISFIGKLVDIEVTEALSYSLLGTLHNPRGKN
ncbi:tRNA (N6-isopentenyl adenosine(37)-C2)-methylthiotransferase MiaB [Gammaproteobacteria bacterium]|jgi:tRNA-2-methylthio-N6-dimethylallyladenosine synthase|nr:tRNA (N6-isopentenyl adenosine(37)-C2)-methylthiotransferase MiaB [Gammaproteobacteria bacterium]MDA9574825.1 tRNA (N6-isopentenyl adenosine(37)-C2)-methylthiotransferase MiaB [Gammaproteobacteria bacterium]MDA9920630.1 tRNA (N6-isopentenyl adenosine(37)-C2)-methylthiotransferase MiaB [Gammaproteobacteria bacterium]MDB2503186.1 tRNA (N6-isopentenyl adenosine(37)-C2)-methylthiotransferase MiaB [Gammaproteobacteria bacterium]MDB2604218.1 tRNA (N6-isopentenyl adenosine(37)-C2)-methylthiotransfe